MHRRAIAQLQAWKFRNNRKPLVLMGARQVGKTYLLKTFSNSDFENTVYLNFEDSPRLCSLFDSSLDPKIIINALKIEMNTQIQPGKTLIIFDEVQECPNALNSLKYFCEDCPEQHLCAAGSLLGVKLVHTKGFPVGKVEFLELYPLSFMEFLEAKGENRLLSFLSEIQKIEPLPSILHEKALGLFKEYLFTGGMPEAVQEFVKKNELSKVRDIQQAILQAYSLDFAKHAPKNELMKINQVWQALPNQLAKENKKFVYSALRPGARAREFENALQWLLEAGLIHKSQNVTVPKIPLSAYADLNIFKIFIVDVGLLGAMSGLAAKTLLYDNQLFQEFKGALVENYVAQELTHSQLKLFYWTSEGKAELDFLIEYEGDVYPMETKSGQSTKKKSMHAFQEKYKASLVLRCSAMNLKKDDAILNCPLYLLGRIKDFIQIASP